MSDMVGEQSTNLRLGLPGSQVSTTGTTPLIRVIPGNDEAINLARKARGIIHEAKDEFHGSFLGPQDTSYDLSLENMSRDGGSRGWVLGILADDNLTERRVHGVLGMFIQAEQTPGRPPFARLVTVDLDDASGLIIIHTRYENTLEVLHKQLWRPFQSVPNALQRPNVTQALGHGGIQMITKWFIHNAITRIRILEKFEFELHVNTREDLSDGLITQRDAYISRNLGGAGAAPLLSSLIPDPGSKVSDYLVLSLVREDLSNQQVYLAINYRTWKIRRLVVFVISTADERDALLELQQFYLQPRRFPGILYPIRMFCAHTTSGCAHVNDHVHLVYKNGLCSFDTFDWVKAPRDTRLALIFCVFVGISKLHGAMRSLNGEDWFDLTSLIVMSVDPEPRAVLGCLREAPRLRKDAAKIAAGRDLLALVKVVASVIEKEFSYQWADGDEIAGLQAHARSHNEDEQLVNCLLEVFRMRQLIIRGERYRDYPRAGNLLNHPCWDGLGQWHVIKDRLFA